MSPRERLQVGEVGRSVQGARYAEECRAGGGVGGPSLPVCSPVLCLTSSHTAGPILAPILPKKKLSLQVVK